MSRFRYVAYTADGVREEGNLEAATEAQAWGKLTGLKLTVVELRDDRESVAKVSNWLLQRRIPVATQAELAEQLAVLFEARLTAMQIAHVIEQGAVLPAVKRKFHRIGQLMADGYEFPNALQEVADGLSPLFVSLSKVGQATGDPAPILRSLASTLRRQEKMASQINGALVYPLILVIGGIGVMVLMALYLAPRLETIFTSANRPVPGELVLFIGIGDILRNWGLQLSLSIAALSIAAPVLFSRYRHSLLAIAYRLPFWGPLASTATLSRLSRSMQMLLAAGMPLAPALRQAASMMPGDRFATIFDEAGASIEAGNTGRDTFAANQVIPALFRELFAIGERTNTLPSVMASVATALEDQVERRAQKAITLVTPILTLVIGGAIALVVYAVMAALLSVNDLAF
jgi:general secretion pathway protein F